MTNHIELINEQRNSPRKRKRDLLHNLVIEDNKIYDKIHKEASELTDSSTRKKRLVEPANYNVRSILKDLITPHDTPSTRPSVRQHVSNIPRVQVVRDNQSLSVKIHYKKQNNTGKNIIRLRGLNSSKQVITGDYSVSEEDLEIPFRGLFPFKDANTFYTRPSNENRLLFNTQLKNSESLLLANSDLSLVKKLTKEEETLERDLENQILVSSKLRCIHIGNFEIDTWYRSPYPEEFISKYVLHLCEYCLKYFNSSFSLNRHKCKCQYKKQPPGNEIYRDKKIALFEVDGRKNIIYCQSLCLFAKLYLNSKTLYYDVEPFMFYVLYELDQSGPIPSSTYNFVGYFSKEKLNGTNYNLSCILTLPIYQRKGYGNLLIDFSYLLTRKEYKLGTPEKPLSDLGLLSYRNYWKISVARALQELYSKNNDLRFISIDDLANYTGMIHNDVIVGLEQLKFLVKDLKTNKYGLKVDMATIDRVLAKWDSKNYHKPNPDLLVWKSVVLGPSGGINTSSTMVITTNETGIEDDKEEEDSTESPSNLAKFDDKGNRLMSNVSLILNFLRDDLDDDRDIQDQIIDKLNGYSQDDDLNLKEPIDFANSVICSPGTMDHLRMVTKKEKTISGTTEDEEVHEGERETELPGLDEEDDNVEDVDDDDDDEEDDDDIDVDDDEEEEEEEDDDDDDDDDDEEEEEDDYEEFDDTDEVINERRYASGNKRKIEYQELSSSDEETLPLSPAVSPRRSPRKRVIIEDKSLSMSPRRNLRSSLVHSYNEEEEEEEEEDAVVKQSARRRRLRKL